MLKSLKDAAKIQIHTGVHLHRRKQVNIVTNEDGEPLWTGTSIFKACRWCLDNGHHLLTLHHDEKNVRVLLGEPLD